MNTYTNRKITFGYILAVAILMAVAAYSYFVYRDLNNTNGWISEMYREIILIENISSDVIELENHSGKVKSPASEKGYAFYVGNIINKVDQLGELYKNNSFRADRLKDLLEAKRSLKISFSEPDSNLNLQLNRQELKEYLRKKAIGDLKVRLAEIKQAESDLLQIKKAELPGKEMFVIKVILFGGFVSVLIIIISLYIISKEIREKAGFEKIQNVLFDLSEAAHNTRDIEELYAGIHEILGGLLCLNNFFIALYDSDENILSYPWMVNEFDDKPDAAAPAAGLAEYVMRTRKPLLIDSAEYALMIEKGEIETRGKQPESWLGVPLKNNDDVFGVMAIQSYDKKKVFSDRELAMMNYVSEQVAMSILRKRFERKNLKYIEELECKNEAIEKSSKEMALMNGRLIESEKKLKELNANKDKYFSILSHDLKSPFNSLIGFSNILLEDFEDLTKEDIKKYVGLIAGSTQNLYSLIENILQWSKLQRDKQEFIPAETGLKGEITFIFDLLNGNALKKNISLVNKVEAGTRVFADVNMLHSVLQNLVSNAIKFTPAGGRVVVEASEKKDLTEIIIADTGVGIKKDNMEKLFRIEQSFSTKGTENEQGTGLGLILVKEMVEKHNGNIKVSSVEGKGTAFFIEFPKKMN